MTGNLICGAAWGLIACLLSVCVGCGEKEEPVPYKPREAPKFAPPTTSPATASPAATTQPAALPPRHPPISQPADAEELKFQIPQGWVEKPARMMTLSVYAAPKVEEDPEDADVAISTLDRVVPLQLNIDRWCSQFVPPAGQSCATRQEKIDQTRYPTTLVEISGSYRGGSMFTGPTAPKPNYRMLAAEILTPGLPYYIKMVGPDKTVERWRELFVETVRTAK